MGTLPFPDPAAIKLDELAGTLDYPPRGSVEEHRTDVREVQEIERLSEPPPLAEHEEETEKR
jgi:hypothetical protein